MKKKTVKKVTKKVTAKKMGEAYTKASKAVRSAELKEKIGRAKKEGKGWKVKKLEKELVQGEEYWRNRPVEDMTKDWNGQTYEESKSHPHRQLILDVLKTLEPFAGVLEVGCNSGPNLALIQEQYPETQMAGVDVNAFVIEQAKSIVPGAILKVGEATTLPFEDKSFDVLLYDAVLMYVNDIKKALQEADRVARRAVIILDRNDKVLSHELVAHITKIMMEPYNRPSQVTRQPIKENEWPTSKGWQEHGFIIVATR